ncbi:erythroblast NAD(P)(+)--arginine ADP-ribosyltransferase [Dunckerocampus dactyliophorus]|uniref:erythroblast NAD(P)(+)--arginine ADP-ribosyltransferase n=1 Tax=Dunckerocampus dactyliophorus TaxID=161453 RepID=UPI0024053B4F|nr:erythroblast NAD(P)(+)--arginine ADP-ribosyltransferase [Dunckerocampus dactyliophorus]XP_054634813.1 erythroblast NAD(P)(+)--arginine ADP-ribosyltransferase [Dunckerocampus dactyliophorus]
MWDKTFLALVTVTVVCGTVSAVKQLNMAPNAVDDLYQGCREQAMEELIHSDVLGQELSGSEGFQTAWNDKCPALLPGGVKEHTAALLAYASGNAFLKAFNNAVETMGVNVSTYKRDFHFKSLHFLLMDIMKLVKPATCKNVYRVSSANYIAEKGSKVRFGRFTTAHSDLSVKEDVEGGVYFNITTCFFVSLEGFCGLLEDIAILSPTEEFTVVDVKQVDDYKEIILKHSKLEALHNCYSFPQATTAPVGGRASAGSSAPQWLVLVLMTWLHFS